MIYSIKRFSQMTEEERLFGKRKRSNNPPVVRHSVGGQLYNAKTGELVDGSGHRIGTPSTPKVNPSASPVITTGAKPAKGPGLFGKFKSTMSGFGKNIKQKTGSIMNNIKEPFQGLSGLAPDKSMEVQKPITVSKPVTSPSPITPQTPVPKAPNKSFKRGFKEFKVKTRNKINSFLGNTGLNQVSQEQEALEAAAGKPVKPTTPVPPKAPTPPAAVKEVAKTTEKGGSRFMRGFQNFGNNVKGKTNSIMSGITGFFKGSPKPTTPQTNLPVTTNTPAVTPPSPKPQVNVNTAVKETAMNTKKLGSGLKKAGKIGLGVAAAGGLLYGAKKLYDHTNDYTFGS